MKPTFVELPAFARHRENYLDDDEFRQLHPTLLANPDAGDRIPGSGGLKKTALAGPGDGQRRPRRPAGDLFPFRGRPSDLAVHAVREE